MAIDTAMACRWFGRRGRRCYEYVPCMPSVPPSCGGEVIMPGHSGGATPEGPPMPPAHVPPERQPPVVTDPAVTDPPVKEPPVRDPAAEDVKKPETPPKADPLGDLFDTPPKEDVKTPPADAAKESPLEDLPKTETSAKEEMPKEKVDDLFDTPPAKETPAKEIPTAEIPAAEIPGKEVPETKPAEKADDLFDIPKETPAAEAKEPLAPELPAAKEDPTEATPKAKDDLGDLFDGDKKPEEKAAEKAVEKVEELLPAGDATEAAPPKEAAKDAVDDLFEEPAKEADEGEKMAQAPAATAVEPVSLALIKKPLAIEAKDRDWRDDTGQFGCRGRLVLVSDGKVRILKDTGRYTTVPFDRLSEADLGYVRQEATRAATPAVNTTAQK
jgi:hypothetical protein